MWLANDSKQTNQLLLLGRRKMSNLFLVHGKNLRLHPIEQLQTSSGDPRFDNTPICLLSFSLDQTLALQSIEHSGHVRTTRNHPLA